MCADPRLHQAQFGLLFASDAGTPQDPSSISARVTAGVPIYLVVDGFDGATGTIVLNWNVVPE